MKRPPRSFVVEVRRQRRPPGEPALSWAEESLKSGANETAREPEPPPAPAAETVTATAPAPARRTGRILPSLIEAVPEAAPAAEAKPKAPARPKAQRRPRKPAPAPVRVVEPPPAVAPPQPVAEPAAEGAQPDRAARHRRILARYVFGDSLKPGERWKRRRRGDAP
jgi:hypothetical protein